MIKMLDYGDYDSILCIINQVLKPFKKKNLHYLLEQHQDIVDFRDISAKNDAMHYRQTRPWFIIKNIARGIFVIQKIIEFFDPWITFYLQKQVCIQELENNRQIESIYLLFTQVKATHEAIKRFYKKIPEEIIDEDARFKTDSFAKNIECDMNNLWLILRNNNRALNTIKEYESTLNPWVIIWGQITLYKEMIPSKIIGVEKWTKQMERNLGHLKVQI